MNTKTKNFVAILMATIIAMAMFAPTAMGLDTDVVVVVSNEPPEVICKCECSEDMYEASSCPPCPVISTPDPEETVMVTVCAVACDPNGDDLEVSATVYNPDGTVLQTVYMALGTCPCCGELEPCVGPEPVLCPEPDGIPDPETCKEYVGSFPMTIQERGGEYRVVVTASDGEYEDKLQNRFFYESWVYIDINFDEISFDNIKICEWSYDSPGFIHNGGNDPIQIGYHFSGFKDDAGKLVPIDFDVDDQILTPCDWYWDGVLDGYCDEMNPTFSLHVKQGVPAGEYRCTLEITAVEGPHTILLEDKDSSDIDLYEPILVGGKYGEFTYWYNYGTNGEILSCEFNFTGYGLGDKAYCLIYYPEPWPGTGGFCLGQNTTENGEVYISGPITRCLPDPNVDLNYDRAGCKYAKIWLVPCDDYDEGAGELNKWNPSEILFDMETICFCC